MPIKDGRKEIAQAIAKVSGLVRVDITTTPFTTVPDDLFDRTFNDNLVGIDDERMADFKESLKILLAGDGINQTINRIPENANLIIRKIAKTIRLALALNVAQQGLKQ